MPASRQTRQTVFKSRSNVQVSKQRTTQRTSRTTSERHSWEKILREYPGEAEVTDSVSVLSDENDSEDDSDDEETEFDRAFVATDSDVEREEEAIAAQDALEAAARRRRGIKRDAAYSVDDRPTKRA
jgi:hypothetical protein